MKNNFIYLLLISIFFPVAIHAQAVTGIVKDATGPLSNVSVIEKGISGNGTTTNNDGRFSLTLRGNSRTLVISSVNYVTQEVEVGSKKAVQVILQPSDQGLNAVVVVGFGKKKRITNTGAVSTINASEIRNIPTSNVQNALTGKLPGFFSQQRSGQPGRDASDYFIRGVSSLNPDGNKPLIIVDDIEYTYEQLSQINVNEIESISILKDASTTAIYGIKGANGVLVVTTRRGSNGKPKVNVRVEGGEQSPVKTPKFLDSYQTATLVNEAYKNDGLQPLFTQNDLDLYKSGADPYGHPYVNWYDAIMRPYSLQANTNIDISGGTEAVKYFISGGAFTQNGTIRDFSTNADGVNSNYFYKRYNIRTNLDVQATKTLSLRLDLSARFGDINQPHNQNVIGTIYDFSKIHPYSAPFLNPNGSYSYAYDTKGQLPTMNAMLQTGGYDRSRRTDFNVLFGGTQKLDAITRGLSFIGRVAFAGVEQNTLKLFRDKAYPPAYHYNPEDNSYTLDPVVGGYTLAKWRTTGNTDMSNQRLNLQFYFNYDRNFGSHHISSLLLYNQESYRVDKDIFVSGQVPSKFRGYSFKAGYDYEQKYLLDINAGYNGSDRFGSANRFGLFPAISVGWNLAQESFFKNVLPEFSLLKIRASYGLVGSDVAPGNHYLYNQVYNAGGGYSFGQNNTNVPTIYEGDLGNNNVTWEKSKKADVGIDANLFKDKITLTIDYFHDIRYDQLVTRGSISEILGVGYAPTNVAKTINRGFDGQITYHDNLAKFQYSIGIVFSIAKNKILFEDEAQPRYPWLAKTGRPINQPFGYTFTGFYSTSDITDPKVAKPLTAYPIQAGDLKYKDLNNDGVIDQSDAGPIGKPNLPNTTIGVPIRLGYKGFDINVLFQGAFGYSLSLTGTGIEAFQSQFQPIHLLRWTEATAATADFPRLTSNPTTVNSAATYMSDFWLIDAHYVRLKTLEVGYQFPDRLLPLKLNNIRAYLSAYNLFTWSNIAKKYQADPEVTSNSAGDAYLNQRVVNLGLQVGF